MYSTRSTGPNIRPYTLCPSANFSVRCDVFDHHPLMPIISRLPLLPYENAARLEDVKHLISLPTLTSAGPQNVCTLPIPVHTVSHCPLQLPFCDYFFQSTVLFFRSSLPTSPYTLHLHIPTVVLGELSDPCDHTVVHFCS